MEFKGICGIWSKWFNNEFPLRKGGLNSKPITPRPPPPKGQVDKVFFHEHGVVQELKQGMDQIHSIFDNMTADEYSMNWLFLSTSGIHGNYTTLDDIQDWYDDPDSFNASDWLSDTNKPEDIIPFITVLIVQPRLVNMLYGHIRITEEDIPYLRDCNKRTLEIINCLGV